MFNRIFGEGRLVADPELKDVGSTVVASFTLVCNEYRRVNDESVKEPHFFDFKAWDTGAKTIAEKAKKGDRVFFEARARQERWEDKTTGQKRSKVVFRLENFTIVPKLQSDDKVQDAETTTTV
jgi:single-strand DNA-binding protein